MVERQCQCRSCTLCGHCRMTIVTPRGKVHFSLGTRVKLFLFPWAHLFFSRSQHITGQDAHLQERFSRFVAVLCRKFCAYQSTKQDEKGLLDKCLDLKKARRVSMKGTQHTWQQSALVTESQAGGAWLVAKKGGGHTTTSLMYASPKSASFEM